MANPYEPPLSATEHTALGIRFVGTSTLLATIAIAAAFTDVPRTIENHFRNGTIQNVSSLLMTLLFLLSAVFCCWAEWFGTIRLQRFVTFVLTPVALFTIVVVYNFLNDVFYGFRFEDIVDNPNPVLGWIACPVVWYYCFASYRLRWKNADNQALHTEPRSLAV